MGGVRSFVACGFLLAGACAYVDASDAAFLAGLRERRLFELANRYCTDRLSRPELVEPARTDLVVERIRTLATAASHASLADQAAAWQRAREVAAESIAAKPPSPRLVLIRLQDALTPLAEGELGRHEFEAGALPVEREERVRQALREASDLLDALDKELTAEIPLRRRSPPRPPALSADELFALQQQLRRHIARAAKNRALLFEAESADRLALLLRAAETLQSTLAQLPADDPLTRSFQLDLAECQRLLGKHDEAGQLLAALDDEGIEPAVRLATRAELIRLAVAQKDAALIERLLASGRMVQGQSAAELDFAWFEALVALAQAAAGRKDAAAAKQYQDQAAEAARLLETDHGAYWGRRADQLLVAALPRGGGTVNVQLLMRAADRLYLQREFDEALAAYDDAAGQARTAGDLAAAFELSYKAALVERSRQRHDAAARRFRALGKGLATHPQAPAAHLAAAWHLAQWLKDDPAAAEDYAAVLREHLAVWPAHETSAQARLWLGRLLENQSQWAEAAAVYAGVPPMSEHLAAAVAGLVRASQRELADLAAAGESASDAADKAIGRLREIIEIKDNAAAQRAAALAAAELVLAWQPQRAAEAEAWLKDALAGGADADAGWQAAAQAQLVIALTQQPGKADDALAVLRQIGEDRSRLSKELAVSLSRAQADALAAAGRRSEALAAYRRLVAAHPDSGAIQEGYATLLLAGDDRDSLATALARWRIIASRAKPRSELWKQAKYSVALAQFKLGDKAAAATLLRYVLETPPGLGGSAWEEKYRALLKQCSQ
jgi:hypothetical protein